MPQAKSCALGLNLRSTIVIIETSEGRNYLEKRPALWPTPAHRASNPMQNAKKPSMDNTTLPSLAEGGGEGRGLRVLVVDDERDTLMTVGVLLRSESFEVVMLGDGTQVLSEVNRFKPHAVVLDIGMPGRNGYDVANDLRQACGETCPVLIAVTAYASDGDKVRARQSGFNHHLAKPFDPVRLLDLLAAVRGAC